MINKGDINKITNNYILKSLFAYLKYKKILKLVNNKKGVAKVIMSNIKVQALIILIIFNDDLLKFSFELLSSKESILTKRIEYINE